MARNILAKHSGALLALHGYWSARLVWSLQPWWSQWQLSAKWTHNKTMEQVYSIARCHIMIQTCSDFATWLRQRAKIESQSIHAYLASCIWYPCPSECQLPMLTLIKYSLIWHIFDSWRGVLKTFAIHIISLHSPPPRIKSHYRCTICISSNPLPCTFYAQFPFHLVRQPILQPPSKSPLWQTMSMVLDPIQSPSHHNLRIIKPHCTMG